MTEIEILLDSAHRFGLTIEEKYRLQILIGEMKATARGTSRQVRICPFHEEKTPSFYIDTEDLTFRCFGCGVAGKLVFEK